MTSLALEAGIRRATDRALSARALLPLASEQLTLPQGGIEFTVHWLSSLALKDAAALINPALKPANFNPFLPYEDDLFVADLSPTHVALLNKYPLFEKHILMVTRAFEEQLSQLTSMDFDAIAVTLIELDGLVFFNGGAIGGASQRHKHLQWVPSGTFALEAGLPRGHGPGEPARLPVFNFRHTFVALDPARMEVRDSAGQQLQEAFARACAACGIAATDGNLPPYNLLVGRDWMLLVPRSVEHWVSGEDRISMNAMSFAGSLFVRHKEQLEAVRRVGPMALLEAVTYPP